RVMVEGRESALVALYGAYYVQLQPNVYPGGKVLFASPLRKPNRRRFADMLAGLVCFHILQNEELLEVTEARVGRRTFRFASPPQAASSDATTSHNEGLAGESVD